MDLPRLPPTAALTALAALLLGACAGRESPELTPFDEPARPTAAVASGSIDRWLGDWEGAEGRALRLEGGDGRYDITLTEPGSAESRRHHGIASTEERIIFDRDGTTASLTPVGPGPRCLALDGTEVYCRG